MSKFLSRRFILGLVIIVILQVYGAVNDLNANQQAQVLTYTAMTGAFTIGMIGVEDWIRSWRSTINFDMEFEKLAQKSGNPFVQMISDSLDFDQIIDLLIDKYGDRAEEVIAYHRVKDVEPATETLIATVGDNVTISNTGEKKDITSKTGLDTDEVAG